MVFSINKWFLDSYEGVDGIKIGYICVVGFNLIVLVKCGFKWIIVIVLGGNLIVYRNVVMVQFLDVGFGKVFICV